MRSKFICLFFIVLLLMIPSCYISELDEIMGAVSDPVIVEQGLDGYEGVLVSITTSSSGATIMFKYGSSDYRNYENEKRAYYTDTGVVYGVVIPYGSTLYSYAELSGRRSNTISKTITTRTPVPNIINRGTPTSYYYSDYSVVSVTGSDEYTVLKYTVDGNDPVVYGTDYNSSASNYGTSSGTYRGVLVKKGKTIRVVAQDPGCYTSKVVSMKID